MKKWVKTGGSASCRRRYFKREARERLGSGGAGLLIAAFFALAATAGVRAVCGRLPRLFAFSFSASGGTAACVLALLGDIIICAFVFPLWMGFAHGGGLLWNGESCRTADCFVCFGSRRAYLAALRWLVTFFIRGALGLTASVLVLRAARYLPRFCGEYRELAAFALYVASAAVAAAGLFGMTSEVLAPVIMEKNRMMTAAMAAKCSRSVMSGHKSETLRLALSFLPQIAASVLSGGLLFIVTAPYMAVTFAGYGDYIYSLYAYRIESGEYLRKYSYKKRKLRVGDIFTERV